MFSAATCAVSHRRMFSPSKASGVTSSVLVSIRSLGVAAASNIRTPTARYDSPALPIFSCFSACYCSAGVCPTAARPCITNLRNLPKMVPSFHSRNPVDFQERDLERRTLQIMPLIPPSYQWSLDPLTELHKASVLGSAERVVALLLDESMDINQGQQGNAMGWPPLMFAS